MATEQTIRASKAERREVNAITGVRGIAALAIMLFHMSYSFKRAPALEAIVPSLEHYYVFLDLFFIMSGFAVASGYARIFMERVDGTRVREFCIGRLIRIYPLHFLTLAAAVALECAWWYGMQTGTWHTDFTPFDREGYTPLTVLTTALLLHAWGFHTKLTWNIPSWYLSALFFAYLIFPFAMRASAWLSKSRPWLIVLIVGAALTMALHISFARGLSWGLPDPSILRALFEVLLGAGIALIPPVKMNAATKSVLQIVSAGAIIGIVHSNIHDYVLIPAFSLFIFSIREDDGIVARALSTHPMLWLGRISFSLFMMHWIMLVLLDSFPGWKYPFIWVLWQPEYIPINLAIRIAIIVWVAWLTYRFVETPLTASLQRWWKGEARAPVGLRT